MPRGSARRPPRSRAIPRNRFAHPPVAPRARLVPGQLLFVEVIRVLRRRGDRLARVHELARESGDVLTTPLLPGLELKLTGIFRR